MVFFNGIAAFIVFLFFSSSAFAYQDPLLESKDAAEAVRMADEAVGKIPDDYTLVDQDGKTFHLSDYKGKPLVVSFIYTSCESACSTITMNLDKAFRKARDGFGAKFSALTVGFDSDRDTPSAMKKHGKHFGVDFSKWKFASADKKTIEAMTRDFGFTYRKIKSDFSHPNMASVLDSNGRIYAQLYGMALTSDDVLKPVYAATMPGASAPPKWKDAANIKDILRALCYTYDPKTGAYRFDYLMLFPIGLGLIVQGAIVFVIVYLYRQSKRVGNAPL
ncbi:MAG: SCO family protein [Deltaproteobacteria bacterium]